MPAAPAQNDARRAPIREALVLLGALLLGQTAVATSTQGIAPAGETQPQPGATGASDEPSASGSEATSAANQGESAASNETLIQRCCGTSACRQTRDPPAGKKQSLCPSVPASELEAVLRKLIAEQCQPGGPCRPLAISLLEQTLQRNKDASPPNPSYVVESIYRIDNVTITVANGKPPPRTEPHWPGAWSAHFAFDRCELDAAAIATLDAFADRARDSVPWLTITGHADARGGDGYNMHLSHCRALAVAQHLMARGLGCERLRVQVCGEACAATAANAGSEADYAKDRRVDLNLPPRCVCRPVDHCPTVAWP